MKLVKLGNPYYPVNKNLVDDLFDSFLFNDTHAGVNSFNAATNIYETENDFRIELVLPGFNKEEVALNYHKEVLTVKAEKANQEEGNNKYLRREFGAQNVEKEFKLPETINVEKIDAKFENGILVITLPKKEEALEKAPLAISIS